LFGGNIAKSQLPATRSLSENQWSGLLDLSTLFSVRINQTALLPIGIISPIVVQPAKKVFRKVKKVVQDWGFR